MPKKIFFLPDLGEGLPDAEIVEWMVKVGATVALDAPLVSMETAKAVVEVPSPFSGTLIQVFGQKGDVIETGKALAEFALDDGPQRAEGHATGHAHGQSEAHEAVDEPAAAAPAPAPDVSVAADAGSVVGAVQVGTHLSNDAVVSIAGIKAVPAVRALARKLGVDLALLTPSGPDGIVTLSDVKNAVGKIPAPSVRSPTPAAAKSTAPLERAPSVELRFDHPEPLRGVRRNMARSMAEAHAQVVPTTLTEDADVQRWHAGEDLTARLIRALVVASRAEPGLNAWFDSKANTRTLHSRVDVGIAVDSDEGLFVPALRNAHKLDAGAVRSELARLRDAVIARNLPPEAFAGYTLMLSNFGMYAGRYATPVLAPPCVAILAAGRARWQAVPVMGGIEAHRVLPLSLTFDHRACTGGEAARFLRALLGDLERA